MKQRAILLMTAWLALTVAPSGTVNAAPALTLESSDDLGSIVVGQTVTVRVVLSGLAPGDELQYLAATINFDGSLLSPPAPITAGSIVPNPLNDPLDFVTASSYGLADGNFLTSGVSSASHVTSNGTFYSFSQTAQSTGAGQFSISFADALQFNPANSAQPIDPGVISGPALTFSVGLPEPTAPAALIAAAVSFILMRRHQPPAIVAFSLTAR